MFRVLTKSCLRAALILVVCTCWLAAAQSTGSSSTADPIRIKSGVKLMLDLETPLNSATARVDDVVWFKARQDAKVDGRVAVLRGTPVRGSVISVKPAIVNGRNQQTEIGIRLEEIPLADGGSLAVSAAVLKVKGERSGAPKSATVQSGIGAAMQGAAIGSLISHSGRGAGIGALAGVGAVLVASAIQPKGPSSDVDLPAGSIFEAKLERPLNIPDPKMLAKDIPVAPAPASPVAIAAVVPSPSTSVPADQTTSAPLDTSGPSDPNSAESNEVKPTPVPEFGSLASDAAAAPATSAAATPDEAIGAGSVVTPTRVSVNVNLVQVDAIVRDRAGKPMSNLRQEDFRIFEDGTEQHIQFFSRDQQPLALALVIDHSGSVAPLMSQVQSAAYQALRLLKTNDQVSLFAFAGNVELLEELTTDRQRIANRIGTIRAAGGTAIVDAVSDALRYLSTTAPDRRRAVILISDNIEGRSHTSVDRAIAFALESEAVLYSVKVGNGAGYTGFGFPGIPGIPIPGLPIPGAGTDPVRGMAKETGGEIFDASSASIASALTTAVDRLKLRYTLSYASTSTGQQRNAKGGYHHIEVRLVDRFGKSGTDYTIHARSGYYDPPAKTKVAAAQP